MTDAFLNVLAGTSLSAAVMILAAFVLRLRFQERTPRRVFCLLWDLALVRLLVFAELPSPVSIWRLLPALAKQTGTASGTAQEVDILSGPLLTPAAVEGTQVIQEAWLIPLAEDVPVRQAAVPWTAVFAALWLAGAAVFAAWVLWGHLRSRRIYAASLPVHDGFVAEWLAAHPLRRPVQVRASDRIASPLTYGVLYPVVLLPKGMDWENQAVLAWVLTHEHTHIRRFDTLRKGLLAAALCLHWFNPLVWAMYILANRDIELACDEEVLRNREDREGYALALLGMEERRGQRPFTGSYFSQNALEERIRAIMKRKHISITALVAVLVVMCLATTVFAAAAPEGKPDASTASYVEPVEDDGVITMFRGEDGGKLYSVDSGLTWMDEEDYQARYGSWGDDWTVEWWTYEEYKAWLEQEKVNLQDVIGSRAWTQSTGWFTWDQKMVDETIAMYEGILEDIKNGALHSKRILDRDGNEVEDVALGSDGPMIATAFDGGNFTDGQIIEKPVDTGKILEELRAFGVTGDENELAYNGQLIRRLVDGAFVGDNGYAVQYVYTNQNGSVDVHTLRAVIRNPDGSYDPLGSLMGLAVPGDEGFDQDLIDAAAFSGGPQATADYGAGDGFQEGRTFEDIFAKYAPYGLTYLPREEGMGALAYHGQAVKFFADLQPNGGSFSYEDPLVDAGLTLLTVYDANGELTGLRLSLGPDNGGREQSEPVKTPAAPTEEQVLAAREKALAGLSGEQAGRLKTVIREANEWWEYRYLYDNIFARLEDPNDLTWNYFDQKGDDVQVGWAHDAGLDRVAVCKAEKITSDAFYEKYGTPVSTDIDYNAYDFIGVLDELIAAAQDEDLRADLQYLADEMKLAADGHSMFHANNAYKMLHDLDYFLLRYGPKDTGWMRDRSTVSKYYGMLSVYEK